MSTVLETTSSLEMSSPRDRLKTLKQHRLCTRACLSQGHNAKKCPRELACARPGCGNDHHYLIHSSEADGNGIGIDTNGCDTFRSAESNGAAKGTVADLRGVLGSIAAKIGSDSPSRSCKQHYIPPSEPFTVGEVGTSYFVCAGCPS